MKEWVLCLTGVIFLTTIFYLIMPSGKTNSLIKGIFSLVCILILVQPILSLKNNDYDIFNFAEIELNLDDDYLSYVNSKNVENIERACQKLLKNQSLYSDTIDVEFVEVRDYEYKLERVQIKLKNLVIEDKSEHINRLESVRSSISEYFGIEKSAVIFYE